MTDRARIWIAAGVTALFLAGISLAGVAVRDRHPRAATTSQPTVVAPAPSATARASATGEHAGYGENDGYGEGFGEDE